MNLKVAFEQNCNTSDNLKKYGNYLYDLLSRLNYDIIDRIIDCFNKARSRGSTIFFIGNGGSAATASHFAQDLGEVGRKSGKKHFRTLSLTDNVSFITAMGNDYGFEKIFTGQLDNLFKEDDILVAISASGNSPNVIEAVKLVKKLGGVTIGFVGFDGGRLKNLCDLVVHVEANKGEYGPVEDIHLIIDHMITSFIVWRDLSIL